MSCLTLLETHCYKFFFQLFSINPFVSLPTITKLLISLPGRATAFLPLPLSAYKSYNRLWLHLKILQQKGRREVLQSEDEHHWQRVEAERLQDWLRFVCWFCVSFRRVLARVSCVGLFAGEQSIVLERLFLGLFPEAAKVVGMGISGNLMPAGLAAAERVAGEETAGVDHFNDAFSIIFPGYPLPLQKLRANHRLRTLLTAHFLTLQQAIGRQPLLPLNFGNGHIIYIIKLDFDFASACEQVPRGLGQRLREAGL